jgi:hypothetical protein
LTSAVSLCYCWLSSVSASTGKAALLLLLLLKPQLLRGLLLEWQLLQPLELLELLFTSIL